MTEHTPKILLLDIETFPNIGYTWGRWEQNVVQFTQETCIATFAAKWLGSQEVLAKKLPDYAGYKPRSYNDKGLVKDLWKLMDEADIVVAHNGDDFDIKVSNSRFIFHGLTPPSPFKTVDTKKAIKNVARLNSNKLDDIGEYLQLGRKIKTDFSLWEGCINGDSESWSRMLEYNIQDILLLEKVYLQIRPWIKNHPNFTAMNGALCPKCNSQNINFRGYAATMTRKYARFQCKDCGGWGRVVKSENSAKTTNL